MRLRELAESYINFIRNLGTEQSEEKAFAASEAIFQTDVKKFENGALIVFGLPALMDQLKAVRAKAFPWTISDLQEDDITVDESTKAAVVFFNWEAKDIGQHLTAVRLNFEGDKISSITEVFNKRNQQEQSLLQK